MKKLLILDLKETNRLALECRCGTETILDLSKPIAVPRSCPACGMVWADDVIRNHVDSLKNAFQALTALNDTTRFPTFTFRVVRED